MAISILSLCIVGILVWSAALVDLRTGRIPNQFVLVGAAAGVLLLSYTQGLTGLQDSLSGLGLGLALMLPGYLLRSTGAGDVKLMAAMGANLGPLTTLYAFALSMVAGAIIGLGYAVAAARRRGAIGPFARYRRMLQLLFVTGRFHYTRPGPEEAMSQRFAFALPIAIGTTAAALWAAVPT